ncbi:MAG: Lrp/AsnC family transcriptional regulator [Thermincola sp.]|nr:Lrp/AsnC family transcriptional regulator [Thermincola sp.]MDT3703533.1 Lrp/AsnC family transcriptional regulator [Thermincola sp.]
MKVDSKDWEILEVLENNSRLRYEQVGAMLDLETAEVEKRVREMEEKRIIVKYHTLVNWEKAGSQTVSALIEVKVTPQRGSGFDNIAERIYRFPEVKTVYLMSGSYDISVLIEGKTMKEVAFFVATKLATIEDVQATATHFVLKKYKQEGIILEDKEEDRRLVISP